MNFATFRAFKSKNYSLYFFGQSVSLIGTWMQRTAVYWVIYLQTHSAFLVGTGIFAAQFPSFVFSLFGGVIADRFNRFKVLVTTQASSLIQAVLMTLLVLFTVYNVWEIMALSVVLGIINAFDVPARQSLMYELVEKKEDLSNAIALNSSMVNLARLLGPAMAGIVLAKFGPGFCFSLNALSFVAVLISLSRMKLPVYSPKAKQRKIKDELRDGWNYLKKTPIISTVILLLASMSLTVMPYATLLPVFAKEILMGNAATYGYLNSFTGVGAIIGTLFLASLKPGRNLQKVLLLAVILLGLGLIAFSFAHSQPIAFAILILVGFGTMAQTTLVNTIIQTNASVEMRGRIISYFAMAFFGMQPIGALLVGRMSEYIGTQQTLFTQGVVALIIAMLFFYYINLHKVNDPSFSKNSERFRFQK